MICDVLVLKNDYYHQCCPGLFFKKAINFTSFPKYCSRMSLRSRSSSRTPSVSGSVEAADPRGGERETSRRERRRGGAAGGALALR